MKSKSVRCSVPLNSYPYRPRGNWPKVRDFRERNFLPKYVVVQNLQICVNVRDIGPG